ncbi:MAG: PilN domain-containing protein [Thermoguttaceae bacterium]
MLDLDFLPAQYRRRQARKRSKPWHAVVVLAFLGLVSLAAVGQHRQLRSLRAQLALLEPRYEHATAVSAQLAQVQESLKEARAEAALFTYLQHPWPRTQLLRSLLEPLPEELFLTELEIANELPTAASSSEPPLQPKRDENAMDALSPAERDLAELRQRNDALQTVIRITGSTDDGAALHGYLGELSSRSLFRQAELESIESMEGASPAGVHFRATVVVRPGYGRPGGPTGPEHHTLAGPAGH